jgi:hypothetical protein
MLPFAMEFPLRFDRHFGDNGAMVSRHT